MDRLLTDNEAHQILQKDMHTFMDTCETARTRAFREIREYADQGYAEAKCDFAILIRDGKCTNKDPERAFNIAKELANTQYPKAEDLMGRFYEKGDAVAKDIREAVKWYLLAVEHGYRATNLHLDEMYKAGLGAGITDSTDGIKTQAAFCEYREVMYRIAMNLLRLTWDLNKGMEWLQRAAENNCPEAVKFFENYSDEDLKKYKEVMEKLEQTRKSCSS